MKSAITHSYAPLVSSPLVWFTRQSRPQPRLKAPPQISRKPIRAIYRRISFDLGPPPPSETVSRTHSFRVDLEGIFLLKSLRGIPLPDRELVKYLRAIGIQAPRALKRTRDHDEDGGERPAKRRRQHLMDVAMHVFVLNEALNSVLSFARGSDTTLSLAPLVHGIPAIPVSNEVK